MAYDRPFSDPLAFLSKSIRIGRPFGIETRVYVTALFVVLVGTSQYSDLAGIGTTTAFGLALLSAVLLYLVVFTHELGHAFAGRVYGVRTPTITLSAFGGLAHMSSGAPSPRADLRISLAGPLTHLPWIGIGYGLAKWTPPLTVGDFRFDLATGFWQMNLALLLFNLLPAFPMDGGRALRALLAHRLHPNRATLIACRVGIVAAIGIGAWGISRGGFSGMILIVIAINNTIACMREMAAARHTDGPYAAVDPWSSDGDEWKRGVAPDRHATIAGEILGRPAPRPSRRVIDAIPPGRTAAEDDELDRLLERVSDVGIAGLSPDERDRLRRLSEAPRVR